MVRKRKPEAAERQRVAHLNSVSSITLSRITEATRTGDVEAIFSTIGALAALKTDGSVVTWGCSVDGGDSSAVQGQLAGDVKTIFSANGAFAALKADGSVVAWGMDADDARAKATAA